MTAITVLKIGWKQVPILVFFLFTLCAHGAAPLGYTLVYKGNFYGPTAVNGNWDRRIFFQPQFRWSRLLRTSVCVSEVVLMTNNGGYWPVIRLSRSIKEARITNSAELAVGGGRWPYDRHPSAR